ncbi:hypothetical protein ABAC460_23740 [Asticcacaulis sp. AC460]|uniref:arsenic resistance N-acetyltransferase ArsN2 n=1 Tax=Asticcacaulis sp. AC460 TaxID=1282360 RepID=UPI0003C3E15A|nr:arsenic resistance N-acetyltransferase ArsN2 [Asticcacaulis sp. AC460]ESQ85372.1 hypothetical protein ABAC460_23740 [Asticcacaulis sp. AC460]
MFEPVDSHDNGLVSCLEAEGLPTIDLDRPGRIFWNLSIEGQVTGYVGMEIYGDAALLRSLAVLPQYKGKGYGARLVAEATGQARLRGVSSLWLLTKTAEPFFSHLGWRITERGSAPEAVARSDEFAGLCPASALCMSLRI